MSGTIKVCDIEKYYGTKETITKAIDRVSFQMEQGEFTGVMGASGSGKTTLLNVMSTIDKVTSGHICYGDIDITQLDDDGLADFRKEHLGFIFQDFNLLDTLTLEENIILAQTIGRKAPQQIQKETEKLMKTLGIWEIRRKFPYQVSGGQKQRCACARALITRPDLVFADEPTGALDSGAARVLLETFEQMNRELGATILMVTHDAFSASYCRRILFLKDGKIFHELRKGEKTRNAFFQQILEVLSLTGGELSHAE